MVDDSLLRLLSDDRRRYWLENGWSIRFRIAQAAVSAHRPHGVRYSLTLHDEANRRLLGFDNAHGLPRLQAYDHRHRFRRTGQLLPYEWHGADQLIGDFFGAVERACAMEGVAFEFVDEDIDLAEDVNDEAHEPGDPA